MQKYGIFSNDKNNKGNVLKVSIRRFAIDQLHNQQCNANLSICPQECTIMNVSSTLVNVFRIELNLVWADHHILVY